MGITLVIHEATRTGAPRIGGLLARELALREPTKVIAMKGGPLAPWLAEMVGEGNLAVFDNEEFWYKRPFSDRLELARKILSQSDDDIVYVNSLAASVFALAANVLGKRVILHIHEKSTDSLNLLSNNVTKLEVLDAADAVVFAAAELTVDAERIFGRVPARWYDFGIAVDVDAVRSAADLSVLPARNAGGDDFVRSGRLVVGMCGHASPRKGAEIFFDTARSLPNCDFLWVGGWTKEEAIENNVYEMYLRDKLPNFYITNSVDNPYPYIQSMDIFFLSSREDPNPVALAEALVLGVPLLCFSKTTGVADRLGRAGILCYGLPNVPDAVRVLTACDPAKIRDETFRAVPERFVADFDLRTKAAKVYELIENVRQSHGDAGKDQKREA